MVCFFYTFMPFLIKQDETIQFCKKGSRLECVQKKILFNISPSGAVQCKFVPRYLKKALLLQSIRLKENYVLSVLFYNLKEVLQTEKYIQSAAYVHECRSYKIILKCNWIPQDNCVPWAYCMYVLCNLQGKRSQSRIHKRNSCRIQCKVSYVVAKSNGQFCFVFLYFRRDIRLDKSYSGCTERVKVVCLVQFCESQYTYLDSKLLAPVC